MPSPVRATRRRVARPRPRRPTLRRRVGDVTLLCFCRTPERCHRSLLADALAKIARAQSLVILPDAPKR